MRVDLDSAGVVLSLDSDQVMHWTCRSDLGCAPRARQYRDMSNAMS